MKLRVLDVVSIQGREGDLATLAWPGGPEPKTGDVYRRADGAEWVVSGVETRLLPLRAGHPVGLLLRGMRPVLAGDELEKLEWVAPAPLLYETRDGSMHDPHEVAGDLDAFGDVFGDRASEAAGKSLHDAADVLREAAVYAERLARLLQRLLDAADEVDERGEPVLGADHAAAANLLLELAEEARLVLRPPRRGEGAP